MFHTIYKTTNILNNEFYIGYHKTKNPRDSYLGSGIRIKRSIKKYGKENFKKEILFISEIAEEAFQKEKELVNEETIKDPLCLNLKIGGEGGFDYIARNYKDLSAVRDKDLSNLRKANKKHFNRLKEDVDYLNSCKEQCLRNAKLSHKRFDVNSYNKENPLVHSDKSKKKISDSHKGDKNPNYGYRWVIHPSTKEVLKVREEDLRDYLDMGWVRGKTIK